MNKAEFIAKYGIEKYEKAKERCRLWHKNKHKKRKEDDFSFIYRFKVPVPDDYTQCADTYDAYRKAEFRVQDHIRKKWYRYSKEQYIIVVEWKTTNKTDFLFQGELYRRNLTDKDMETFKQICEETKQEFKITPINIDEDEK